jgi:uncharacterized protein YecE (DUF72 family)
VTVHVGTSGWQYRDWRGPFYPAGLRQSDWLGHYAERFATVEVNNSFYRLPEAETFASWKEHTPDDFIVAVKASRYITHVKRLRDAAGPVTLLMERASRLGDKLGPVLLQLPPTMRADPGRLDETLAAFPPRTQVAVELRHASWFSDEVRAVLERHHAALCLADRRGEPQTPIWHTADWAYLRLHEGESTPPPCYSDPPLRTWGERLRDAWGGDADAFVYFNNDGRCCAVADAIRFAAIIEELGMPATRVPTEPVTPVS